MSFNLKNIIQSKVSEYLIENELIEEGISDIAYHFTRYSNLLSILKNDEFVLSDAVIDNKELKFTKGSFYFLSTTRSRKSGFNLGSVKLVLDAKKISEKYRILPVKYFSFMRDLRGSEQEDRVISNSKIIPNATSYIKEIHIENLSHRNSDKRYMMNLISHIAIHNIPYFIYEHRGDFLNQTNSLKGEQLAKLMPTQSMISKNSPQDSGIPYSELLYKCFTRDIVGFSALLSINNEINLNSIKHYLRKRSDDEIKYRRMEKKLSKTISDLEIIRDENYHSFYYFMMETLGYERINYKCREFEHFLYKLLSREIKNKQVKNLNDYFFIKKYNTNKSLSKYKSELEIHLISTLNKSAKEIFELLFPYWVTTPSGHYENGFESPEIAELRKVIVSEFIKVIKEQLNLIISDFDSDLSFKIDYSKIIPSFQMKASDNYNKKLYKKLVMDDIDSKKFFSELIQEGYLRIRSELEHASMNKIKIFKKEYD